MEAILKKKYDNHKLLHKDKYIFNPMTYSLAQNNLERLTFHVDNSWLTAIFQIQRIFAKNFTYVLLRASR